MSHSERSEGEEGDNLWWELERVHARAGRSASREFVPEIFRRRRGASRRRRRRRRRRRWR